VDALPDVADVPGGDVEGAEDQVPSFVQASRVYRAAAVSFAPAARSINADRISCDTRASLASPRRSPLSVKTRSVRGGSRCGARRFG